MLCAFFIANIARQFNLNIVTGDSDHQFQNDFEIAIIYNVKRQWQPSNNGIVWPL